MIDVSHLAHASATLAVLMDAEDVGTLDDDRPKSGKVAAMLGGGASTGSN